MKMTAFSYAAAVATTISICLLPVGSADAQIPGSEMAASVNLSTQDAWADGELFIAEGVEHVRCVLVVIDWGLGYYQYIDQELRKALRSVECGLLQLRIRNIRSRPRGREAQLIVRDASEGGANGLVALADAFADGFGRPELSDVPYVFWGHSAAGTFGLTFAGLYPERTLAFVRYNSHLRDLSVDMSIVTGIPGLLIAGAMDEVAGTEDARNLWAAGRAAGAPWALAIQPGSPHGSEEFLSASNALLIPWLQAVVALRVDPRRSGLRPISKAIGWLAEEGTGRVRANRDADSATSQTSWLPDEASAHGWQVVTGTAR
jgi:hypothetical protein